MPCENWYCLPGVREDSERKQALMYQMLPGGEANVGHLKWKDL